MKVAILATGRTEWYGLADSLKTLFPDHDFYPLPTAAEVRSGQDKFPLDGFTSTTLRADHVNAPPEAARALVERAAQEALGDRVASPADLVLIIDDLELANINQPDRVLQVFRAAIVQHLDKVHTESNQRIADRTRDVLRERVSFHLLVPMVEALFFADPDALRSVGAAAAATASFKDAPEKFATNDPAYLAADETACPCWLKKKERKRRPKWLSPECPRGSHPKGYLQWLCLDPDAKNCTSYDETRAGAQALAQLRWDRLLQRPADQTRYLRALLDDLSDALGDPALASVPIEVDGSVGTRRRSDPRCVLRNL